MIPRIYEPVYISFDLSQITHHLIKNSTDSLRSKPKGTTKQSLCDKEALQMQLPIVNFVTRRSNVKEDLKEDREKKYYLTSVKKL